MKSDDWQPMDTAPLNPYGKAYGPKVLIWDSASEEPVAAYYEPSGSDEDNKPRWVVASDGTEIPMENAVAWMPIAAPINVRMDRPPEGNEIGDGNIWEFSSTGGWTKVERNIENPAAALAARIVRDHDAMRVAVNAAFKKVNADRSSCDWISVTPIREALLAALEAIAMEDAEK